MESDEEARRTSTDADVAAPRSKPARGRRLSFVIIAIGALAAVYLASRAPREQHVNVVLGPDAAEVLGLELTYVDAEGEIARAARMTFEPGKAPRVVSHAPELPNGEIILRIDVDTRLGHRSDERRVTLGGGSTQVDLTALMTRAPNPRTAP